MAAALPDVCVACPLAATVLPQGRRWRLAPCSPRLLWSSARRPPYGLPCHLLPGRRASSILRHLLCSATDLLASLHHLHRLRHCLKLPLSLTSDPPLALSSKTSGRL